MKSNTGFTLIELMITLTAIALLTTIGIPSVEIWIKNDRLTTQINTLASHLTYARGVAASQNQSVLVCPSDENISCGDDWNQGWIVFLDPDRNRKPDHADFILRVGQPLTGGNKLTSSLGNLVAYDHRGFSADTSGSFSLCDDRGTDYIKSISISKTGRVRKAAAGTCPP